MGVRVYERWLRDKRFDYFDGLRSVSIFIVILYHSGPRFGIDGPLVGAGHAGVDLFFVISGFLITTLLVKEKEKYGAINLKNFYFRRALRIFPLYYLMLFGHLLLCLYVIDEAYPAESAQFVGNFFYFFTYTSNWFVSLNDEHRTILYHAWSLAAEEQFYLCWPPVLYLVRKKSRALAMVLLASAVSLAFRSYGASSPELLTVLPAKIISSIPLGICVGVLLSLLLHSRHGEVVFRAINRKLVPEFSVLVLIVSYAFYAAGSISITFLQLVMGFCVMVLSTNRPFLASGLFTSDLVVRYGKVSYGQYLYHMLCLNAVMWLGSMVSVPGVVSLSVVFVASYVVSVASYVYFESYFLGKKKKYSSA